MNTPLNKHLSAALLFTPSLLYMQHDSIAASTYFYIFIILSVLFSEVLLDFSSFLNPPMSITTVHFIYVCQTLFDDNLLLAFSN